MVRVEQTKRRRYCSVCECGIGVGEFVLRYGLGDITKSGKNICDLCVANLADEVSQKNIGSGVPSKSGRTNIVATTNGFVPVPDSDIRVSSP